MVAAIAAIAAATATVHAQEPGSRPTREFVQAAAQSDHFEVLEADIALVGSTDPQVRAFARQMIQDHGQTSLALARATAMSGLRPPPAGISADQAQMLGALQSLRGRDFDNAYVRHQLLAHRSALAVEQGYAASGDTASVRQAAAAAVPLIASHLQMAEQMQAKMGGS